MDEKIKEIERNYPEHKTFLNIKMSNTDAKIIDPIIQDMFKSIRYLLSRITQLEAQLHQAALDIFFWREQQEDSCQKVMELEAQLKKGTCCNILCQTEKLQFEREIKELEEGIEKLTTAQYDYANLLADEINELAGIAHIHGWRSTKVEEGKKARKLILELKEKLVEKE